MLAPAAPIGRLMKKIERQPTVSTSQPPSGGPSAVVRAPAAAAQVPIAGPRASPLYAAPTIARLAGVSRAAATPCAIRAAISQIAEGASAADERSGREAQRARSANTPPAAESVARRTAKQDETRERQHVAVDHPL